MWLRKSCPQKSAVVLKAKPSCVTLCIYNGVRLWQSKHDRIKFRFFVRFFVLGMWKETLQKVWTFHQMMKGNPILIRFFYSTSDNTLTQTLSNKGNLIGSHNPKFKIRNIWIRCSNNGFWTLSICWSAFSCTIWLLARLSHRWQRWPQATLNWFLTSFTASPRGVHHLLNNSCNTCLDYVFSDENGWFFKGKLRFCYQKQEIGNWDRKNNNKTN